MVRANKALIIILMLCGVAYASARVSSHSAAHSQEDPERYEQDTDKLLRPPDQFLAYTLTPSRGPTFRLDEGSARLRLISFLHLANAAPLTTYSPENRYPYGLSLRVSDSTGELVHERTVWFITRKSKTFDPEGGLAQTSSYYFDATLAGEPADQRTFDVDMSAWASSEHRLEIRAVLPEQATDGAVNLIAFAKDTRSDERVAWMKRSLDSQQRKQLASRAGLLSWTRIRDDELSASLEQRHERLSSLTELPLRTMVSTDYRRYPEDEPLQGLTLTSSRPLAFNLRGPVTVGIAALDYQNEPSNQALTLETLTNNPAAVMRARAQTFELPTSDPARALADIGELKTYNIKLRADETARVTLRRPEGLDPLQVMLIVDDAESILGEHPAAALAPRQIALRPDHKDLHLWSTSAGARLRYRIGHDQLRLGELARITVRTAPDRPPATVRYRFPDSTTRADFVGILEQPNERAPFEVLYDDRVTTEALRDVSEPTSHRVWLPDDAEELEVWSDDGEAWVSVSLLSIDDERQDEHRVPYSEQLHEGTRWRYAPLQKTPWYPISPIQAKSLTRSGRRDRLEAQVRLEPDWRTDRGRDLMARATENDLSGFRMPRQRSAASGAMTQLEPSSSRGSMLILEPNPDQTVSTRRGLESSRARWAPYWRVGVSTNHPLECEVPEGQRLHLHIDSSELGAAYRIKWGEKILRQNVLRTRSLKESYSARELTGSAALEVSLERDGGAPATGYIWTNCKPTRPDRAAKLWVLRRVWELDASRPMRLDVPANADETWYVNFTTYLSSASSGKIEVTIDGGKPRRRATPITSLTRAKYEFELAGSPLETPVARAPHIKLGRPTREVIPIGSDLADGKHSITLRWKGPRNERAWLRFFGRKPTR